MGFLDRLLGRKEEQPAPEAAAPEPVCPHIALVPFWDSADDMGNSEKVARYKCESCQEEFSREGGTGCRRRSRSVSERLKLSAPRSSRQG